MCNGVCNIQINICMYLKKLCCRAGLCSMQRVALANGPAVVVQQQHVYVLCKPTLTAMLPGVQPAPHIFMPAARCRRGPVAPRCKYVAYTMTTANVARLLVNAPRHACWMARRKERCAGHKLEKWEPFLAHKPPCSILNVLRISIAVSVHPPPRCAHIYATSQPTAILITYQGAARASICFTAHPCICAVDLS